ncbi:MAG TPA: CvpA family protein [Candidatus Binatia bacterium]|nr:CvpA family protein [Candidatus Binatia bacterium]
MDVAEFLSSIDLFDLLAILFVFAMFILGVIQGTIRRLLGLAAITFSFLLASQLRDPLGAFLAANWTHLPAEYSYMIGYGTVFVAASVATSLVIQGFYRPQPLFARATFLDELLGGAVGVVQGLVVLGAVIVILDSFFRIPGIAPNPNELGILRDAFLAYDGSGTAALFRETLVPAFFSVLGGFVPDAVRGLFVAAR